MALKDTHMEVFPSINPGCTKVVIANVVDNLAVVQGDAQWNTAVPASAGSMLEREEIERMRRRLRDTIMEKSLDPDGALGAGGVACEIRAKDKSYWGGVYIDAADMDKIKFFAAANSYMRP